MRNLLKYNHFFTVLFLFSFNCIVHSQSKTEHSFIGTIQLLDKTLLTYELIFEEDENGNITGKSISDFSGDHRTESKIKGKIDRDANTISFNELDIISTKSDIPYDDFCYVHLYNAKIKLKKKKSVIQGHFYSRFKDDKKCLEGDIYLAGSERFFKKMNKMVKKIERVAPDSLAEEAKMSIPLASKNYLIENNESIRILTEEDHIELNVWDEERLDGDAISVYLNDSIYVKDYYIQFDKQSFTFDNLRDTTKITILANNEGSVPPNSASISVSNQSLDMPINVRLNKGKKANILIIRK